MSILAQGCRIVLFPPPGVKIRRTIQTFFLPNVPTVIAEHDPKRVLLIVVVDMVANLTLCFAGNREGLATPVTIGFGYDFEFHFVGPEEVWAQGLAGSSAGGVNIMVQSVFYD